MSRAVATAIPAVTPTLVDDLSVLLPDWSTHLRARNIAHSTMASYLRVGENLLAYLRATDRPTTVGTLNREPPGSVSRGSGRPGLTRRLAPRSASQMLGTAGRVLAPARARPQPTYREASGGVVWVER